MERFCSNCGNPISESQKFCSSCGVENENSASQSVNKTELLNELKNAKAYFDVKLSDYEKLRQLKNEFNTDTGVITPKELAQISIPIFILSFIVMIVSGAADWILIFAISTIIAGLSILIFIGAIALWIYDLKNNNRRYKEHEEKRKEKAKNIGQLENEIIAYYEAYENCPIAYEYSYPPALNSIISMISVGRADTVKEAINCMIEDEHNAEMLRLQQKTAEEAKKAAKSASKASVISLTNFLRK